MWRGLLLAGCTMHSLIGLSLSRIYQNMQADNDLRIAAYSSAIVFQSFAQPFIMQSAAGKHCLFTIIFLLLQETS
jgi:hypothetical protein